MEDKISNAIETAFESEEKAGQEVVETKDKVEVQPETETKTPETADEQPETKEEAPAEEKAEEKPADEQPEQVAAPKQLRGDFIKSHWDTLDKETKDEMIRLAKENERNYFRADEVEHNTKMFRKTMQPVQGYISEVAESAKIEENEVIRNCVNIVQQLNDNPTVMACNMIGNGQIKFEDPVAVINTIAQKYGIDVKGDMHTRDIPEGYYASAAQAKYEARQAKYVKPDEPDESTSNAIIDYVNNTPAVKALIDSPELSQKFVHQIEMERMADPKSSDITIINRAAEMFEYALTQQTKAQPVEEPKPNIAEQKMAKVVAPKASNPANTETPDEPTVWDSTNINKETARSAEKSVKEALRAMGLDD